MYEDLQHQEHFVALSNLQISDTMGMDVFIPFHMHLNTWFMPAS